MNTPAIIALSISMLGQLFFIRWAGLAGWNPYDTFELWIARLSMAAMAVGGGAAMWFVCHPVAP